MYPKGLCLLWQLCSYMDAHRKHYGTSGEHSLTEEDVNKLLAVINHLEDEVLIRLAVSTGIRREDIVAIPLSGVDFEQGIVSYYETKKKRPWKANFGGTTLTVLQKYRRTLPSGARYLFPKRTNPAKHISGRTAYNILQRWLIAAKLKSRPFHALRSTCIKLCQKRGWLPEQTMALTGDTLRTIQEHYSTPTAEEMRAVSSDKAILK